MRAPFPSLPILCLTLWGCNGFIHGGAPGEGPSASDPDSPAIVDLTESVAPASGLRRLTTTELTNSLTELFGSAAVPVDLVDRLPGEERAPFDNDYTTQEPTAHLINGLEEIATDVATAVVADEALRSDVVGCEPTDPGDRDCLRSFLTTFGRRVLRRPLQEEELEEMVMTLSSLAEASGDFYIAVDGALRVLLQDLRFAYHIELGRPIEGESGSYAIDGYAVASRLSFFLWGTTPDEWLIELAATGDLDRPEDAAAVVDEMIRDDRAVPQLERFHAMWMGYEILGATGEIAEGMKRETRALLERVIVTEGRPWQDIFRESETFVDDALAEHYGMVPPGSDTPVWTSYEGTNRQGLLSHGTFLSLGVASWGDTSPVLRGLAVRERLFCLDLGPPPRGVVTDQVENVDGACKEERYAMHREGGCAGCHRFMDPVGFGLENYDPLGRFRVHDDGRPECEISGAGNIEGVGEFEGPAGLSELMLSSGLFNACATKQAYRFAVGRGELDERDEAALARLEAWAGSRDFAFEEMVTEMVAMGVFHYRTEGE